MRLLRLIGLFLAVLLAFAVPAAAHVTVASDNATKGGSDATITFRVPTESDTLSTVGLKVQLPTDTPIASVLVGPVAGWTQKQTVVKLAKPITTDDGQITEAVSEIDWTAGPGSGIAPGGFGQFVFLAGQLPDVDSLTFKAIQLYSDGSQVAWIETPAAGSTTEPDHPAPVLKLPASAGSGSSGVTVSAAPVAGRTSTALPTTLAVVALVLALLAVLGVLALGRDVVRRRRA